MEQPWYIYIISTVDHYLYTGITTDVERRFREHCSGRPKCARFFAAHKPLKISFFQEIGSRSLALKVEYRLKRLSKQKKRAIIDKNCLTFDTQTGKIQC